MQFCFNGISDQFKSFVDLAIELFTGKTVRQQAFDDLTNVWDVMFPVERYKFINEVVEKITVHIDRVEIEYKTDGLEAVITEAEASNGKNN